MPKPNFKSHNENIDEIIRVDHAGEYGANLIYQSQIDNIKDQITKDELIKMLKQEEKHLNYFKNKIQNKQSRPSALLPIWQIFANLIGKLSLKLGSDYVMLTTEAIEEVIQEHYLNQINYLKSRNLDKDLLSNIIIFREEEIMHQEIASSKTYFSIKHSIFKNIISNFCKFAIKASKVI